MKLFTNLSLMVILVLNFSVGCSRAQQNEKNVQQLGLAAKKILIVYLSRTNNTTFVAKHIQQKVGGEIVALKLVTPYPENYKAIVDQVAHENETGFLPPLKTKIDSINRYDVVFIGFPTWGMQLPPPVKSFLKAHDLSGKTVIPFNTNAGYGIGSAFETVKNLCPKSRVLEGFTTKGGVERDGVLNVMRDKKALDVANEIDQWLNKLSF